MKGTTSRLLISSLAIAALLVACGTLESPPEVPPDLDTYEGLLSALALNKGVLLYDVRSAEEYATGFIPTATNIPHSEIADALPHSHRNKVIVVYCQSGGRSRLAYRALVEKGFKYVFDFGGIANWQGELAQKDDEDNDCGCP